VLSINYSINTILNGKIAVKNKYQIKYNKKTISKYGKAQAYTGKIISF